MTVLTFPIASSDGYYRRENSSVAPTPAEAQKISIETDDIRGVITCHATQHCITNGNAEWRHTRAVVMKNDEMYIVALSSATKEATPNAIDLLDKCDPIDERALTRLFARRDLKAATRHTGFVPA